MRALALLALALLALAFLPVAAGAVSFGEDDRIAVPREPGAPYDAVGLLISRTRDGSFAAGAATLVSPCHVLTAYHVAGGGRKVDEDTRATFYLGVGSKGPGLDDFDHFKLSAKARAVAWGEYRSPAARKGSPDPSDFEQRNGWEDWALLKLETCLGEARFGHGYMRLKAIGTRDLMREGAALPVRSAGFPLDRDASELWLDPDCRIVGQVYSSGWQHDCITLPGNSGGPIIERGGTADEDRIVAINVSHIAIEGIGEEGSDRLFLSADDPTYYEYLSIGVPVAAFIARIAGHLPADSALDAFVKKGSDEHYAKGGEDAAIADIDLALARQPGAGELLLLRGLWKASKGDVEGALGDFSSAEKSPQILTRARYHRARLLLEAGAADSQDEVEGEFTALMDAFKDNPDLRHFRGLARVRREDWSGAIADFSAVLEDRPESAVVYNDRGDAQRALRDYDPALRDYDRAIELAPDWPQAWRDRGYLEHLLAKYGAAERDFRKALAINGSDSEALNGLGLVALAKGEGDLAAVEFDKAILARPQSGVYFANRGAASWVAGDLTAALADFERSILLDPKEPYIRLFEFLALARLGDRALAAARLRAYLAADAEAGWPRPIMDYLLGPGSLEVIEAAVDDAPDDKRDGYRFDRDFYLGQWALVRGDRPGATKRLQEVFDSQLREYLEYDLARADLVALGVKVAD